MSGRRAFELSTAMTRREAVQLAYYEGVSYSEVSRRFGVAASTVRRWVVAWCEEEGSQVPVRHRLSPEGAREVGLRLVFDEGLAYEEVARKLGVQGLTVRRWVAEDFASRGKTVPVRARKSPEGAREEGLRLVFEEGISPREAAELLGVERATVAGWASKHRQEHDIGSEPFDGRPSMYGSAVRKEAARLREVEGLPFEQIAKRLGIPGQTLWQWFQPPRVKAARHPRKTAQQA